MIIIILSQWWSNESIIWSWCTYSLAVPEDSAVWSRAAPHPGSLVFISLVLCIRLGDRVCNLRGHEVRRLYLGPCAPGPAGGLLESPQGIRMRSDSYSPAVPHVGNQELSVCNTGRRRDCFQVSILTSQTVTSLMIFIEGLTNKFR